MVADLQRLGLGVEAVQHGVAEIDAPVDVHAVHLGEPASQLAGQVAVVQPHLDREVFGGGVQLVQVVLALVEVVAHLFVRHRDRSAAAAVGVALLGGGGQLRGGDPVAPVQIDHRAGQGGMGADHLGDLRRVDVDVQVAVHGHLAQLGDQPGVVLGGEEGRVHAEHLGDPQQHGHRQRANVVLDLVEVARRDLQHLGQRGLGEPALVAQLANAGADEGFGHFTQRTGAAKEGFAELAARHAIASGLVFVRSHWHDSHRRPQG